MEVIRICTNAEYQSQNNNNTSIAPGVHEKGYRGDGHGDCEGWTNDRGSGWGASDSEGGVTRAGGGGDGSGTDGDDYGGGVGSGKGCGNGDGSGFGIQGDGYSNCVSAEDGTGECFTGDKETVIGDILFEIGVPEHLHRFFKPLTPDSMLAAQDFIQAETQEQGDAILGMLELKRENITWK